jgi:hypothetical protein
MCLVLGSQHLEQRGACFGGLRPDVSVGAIALAFFAGLGARALTFAHPSAPPVRGWVGGNVCV